jgi:hypothetical protein
MTSDELFPADVTSCSAAEQQAIKDRITELDAQLAAVTAELDDRGDELRRARPGIRALSGIGIRRGPDRTGRAGDFLTMVS